VEKQLLLSISSRYKIILFSRWIVKVDQKNIIPKHLLFPYKKTLEWLV